MSVAVSPEELDHCDSLWNRAAASAAQGDPFCCRTEWQLSFHETFSPRRRLHLRRTDDAVIAFAERRDRTLGPLLEPVEASWLFGCPLLGEGATALLEQLVAERSRAAPVSVLVSGLLPGGAVRDELIAAFRGRCEFYQLRANVMVQASLDGGLDGYLSRRTGRLRRNVRAQLRHAVDAGVTFERVVPASADEAARAYRRMLAVEARSWKGIGRCGMAEPPSREFYGAMLGRLAPSRAGRVMFARRGDDDIGFIFGGMAGDVYRGQQFSFVEEWRAASIGNLLQLEQVRWLCEEGARVYDMGPRMDYKRHWTEQRTVMHAWLLRSAS